MRNPTSSRAPIERRVGSGGGASVQHFFASGRGIAQRHSISSLATNVVAWRPWRMSQCSLRGSSQKADSQVAKPYAFRSVSTTLAATAGPTSLRTSITAESFRLRSRSPCRSAI
jgi:hypothetical protein